MSEVKTIKEAFQEMKKLTAFLCAVAGAALAVFAGCAQEQTFTQKTYDYDGEIVSVAIDVTDRQVDISASEDGGVHIYYYDSEKEYLDIAVSDDDKLTVSLVLDKEWTDFIGTKPSVEYRKIAVEVPDGAIVSLTASTTNEDIKASSLSLADSITLSSNGGNVVCEGVNAGKSLSLAAKNGNITGTLVGGWDDYSITCTIKKGDSNLPESKEGGSKSLAVDCNNGDVNIQFAQ